MKGWVPYKCVLRNLRVLLEMAEGPGECPQALAGSCALRLYSFSNAGLLDCVMLFVDYVIGPAVLSSL